MILNSSELASPQDMNTVLQRIFLKSLQYFQICIYSPAGRVSEGVRSVFCLGRKRYRPGCLGDFLIPKFTNIDENFEGEIPELLHYQVLKCFLKYTFEVYFRIHYLLMCSAALNYCCSHFL